MCRGAEGVGISMSRFEEGIEDSRSQVMVQKKRYEGLRMGKNLWKLHNSANRFQIRGKQI